jgi:hypothetical protein
MQHTRRLIQESGRSIPEIYADLRNDGSEITFFWLRKFASGKVKDPSVNRVEEVYTHLTGKNVLHNGR